MNRILITAVACLATATASAAGKVYKSILPDGTVVYSDTRPAGDAREVELPGIQTYTPPPLPPSTSGTPAAADTFTGYESFEVVSPSDDETLRDSGGAVSISLSLAPPLRPGHTVEIFMNGQSIGAGRGTSASITNVDRGSHSIDAVVRDENGKELARTASVTFHLKQASRLNPSRSGGS